MPPRPLLTCKVERCAPFDLQHPVAASAYDLARKPSRQKLTAGKGAKSWDAADRIPRSGHAGLMDPSRAPSRALAHHSAKMQCSTLTVQRLGETDADHC
jgi:hypothetical protein